MAAGAPFTLNTQRMIDTLKEAGVTIKIIILAQYGAEDTLLGFKDLAGRVIENCGHAAGFKGMNLWYEGKFNEDLLVAAQQEIRDAEAMLVISTDEDEKAAAMQKKSRASFIITEKTSFNNFVAEVL